MTSCLYRYVQLYLESCATEKKSCSRNVQIQRALRAPFPCIIVHSILNGKAPVLKLTEWKAMYLIEKMF